MSRKHAELERELIEELEPRTGRSLNGWMAAIDAAGLSDKNAIIDWLRPQGLTFAHASWLERIHNNGGRPIYLGAASRAEDAFPLPAIEPELVVPPPSALLPAPKPAAPKPAPAIRPQPPTAPAPTALADLLARGKGLKPLAEMLLREINQVVPGSIVEPAGDLVSIRNPAEFAVLLVAPKELRLGLDLGDTAFTGMLMPSRLTGTSPQITHMIVVSDARQIDGPLLDLVRRSSSRPNPSQ